MPDIKLIFAVSNAALSLAHHRRKLQDTVSLRKPCGLKQIDETIARL